MSKFSICEIITIGSLRTFAMAKGKELPRSLANWPSLRVTPDLRRCPTRKNWYANHFKGKHGKLYISLERSINIDFQKNMNCRFLQFRKRKLQATAKMAMCHSIE